MTSQAIMDRDQSQPIGDPLTDSTKANSICVSSDCVGASSPVETFSLLANEDRIAILNAIILADHRGEAPVSFSALRETVDIRDSGRFSYHLQELTDHFLTRSSDGYSLDEDCCDVLIEIIASIDI
jgi:hypothetical protein